jgi:hypothetical protein
MLNFPGHKGNANQKHFKSPPHLSQNGCYQALKQQQILVRMREKMDP